MMKKYSFHSPCAGCQGELAEFESTLVVLLSEGPSWEILPAAASPHASAETTGTRGAVSHLQSQKHYLCLEQYGQERAFPSLYLQAVIFLLSLKSSVASILSLKSWGPALRVRCYPWKVVKPYRGLHKITISWKIRKLMFYYQLHDKESYKCIT